MSNSLRPMFRGRNHDVILFSPLFLTGVLRMLDRLLWFMYVKFKSIVMFQIDRQILWSSSFFLHGLFKGLVIVFVITSTLKSSLSI